MIEKKHCLDLESNVSKLDVEIKKNKIVYEEPDHSFYVLYVWQQELINEMLKKHDEVILAVEYIQYGYSREMTFKEPIKLYEGRAVSAQCEECLKNDKCEKYQKMLNEDFKLSVQNNEQLYNLYLLIGAKRKALDETEKKIRVLLDKKIENAGGALQLEKLGLQLYINETMADTFPIDVAIEKKLLTPKNCKIVIGQFRKDIKGTEHAKLMKKKVWQKKLQIDNIPELI